MSPLSVHFFGSEDSRAPIRKIHYWVAAASLIPIAGLVPASLSILWGIQKLEKKGGPVLLVLGLLGFTVSGLLAHLVFNPSTASNTSIPAVAMGGESAIHWLQPSEGLKRSQETGKPILYDFTASWCGWCKVMDKNVFEKTQDAVGINNACVPVVVMDVGRETGSNPQDIAELQARYKVRGFPTLVIQYPNNGGAREMVGFQGEQAVMNFINQGKP